MRAAWTHAIWHMAPASLTTESALISTVAHGPGALNVARRLEQTPRPLKPLMASERAFNYEFARIALGLKEPSKPADVDEIRERKGKRPHELPRRVVCPRP